ncbi:immunity protein Imm33 domain-containing protein [Flavobacterium sp. 3HN19-14]|uniref:immunity protein Imm33 domain-containing protein n=1 Tax=Flavobacterium sp. 3HN19-14 TaxID=3448133 RepID=UPI003EE0D76D
MKNKAFLILVISIFGFGKANSQSQKRFSDSPKTAIFTTKFVVIDKKEITYVSHDKEDGAWQFFSDDKFENFEEVAKVISLEEILKIDPTLFKLADLPLGYIATRKNIKSEWKIEKIK